jgi:hypothetical protein
MAKTEKTLKRMTRMELAKYASRDLRMLERDCWAYEGGPLPKPILIAAILATQIADGERIKSAA